MEVQVKEDPFFARKGSQVLCSITISYLQALLGTKRQVPSLEGNKELLIPKGTRPGDIIVRKKEGPALSQSSKTG